MAINKRISQGLTKLRPRDKINNKIPATDSQMTFLTELPIKISEKTRSNPKPMTEEKR